MDSKELKIESSIIEEKEKKSLEKFINDLNKKDEEEKKLLKSKNLCGHCKKPLKPFGDKRKNGNIDRKDFEKRKLHLKCWKELKK